MSTWKTMSVADTLQTNSSFRSSFSLAFDKTSLYWKVNIPKTSIIRIDDQDILVFLL